MNENALTEADKQRIAAEEKYRSQVRGEISQNTPAKKSIGFGKGCLVVILVLLGVPILLASLMMGNAPSSTTTTPKTRSEFNANVNFNGSQFVISNLDDFDCENARMEVNGSFTKGGYLLEGNTLETGQQYTIGTLQFAKSDGTRLNTLEIKPTSFSISCRGQNALDGAFWYGEW